MNDLFRLGKRIHGRFVGIALTRQPDRGKTFYDLQILCGPIENTFSVRIPNL